MNACRGPVASAFTRCVVWFPDGCHVERRIRTLPDGSVEMSTLRTVTEEEGEGAALRRMNRANGWHRVRGRL